MEMNPEELYETSINLNNPNVSMIQLTISDIDETDEEINIQLGKNADKRKISMANFKIDINNLDI